MHGAAAVWRRSYVDRVGGYDPALGPRADYFLNHAVAALGGAVFLDEIATHVRHSEDSYGQAVGDDLQHVGQAAFVRGVVDRLAE